MSCGGGVGLKSYWKITNSIEFTIIQNEILREMRLNSEKIFKNHSK